MDVPQANTTITWNR